VRPWDPWSVGISQRGEGRVWHSGGSVMPMRSEEEAMGLGMALELVGGGAGTTRHEGGRGPVAGKAHE
jgi:hypothetical protein